MLHACLEPVEGSIDHNIALLLALTERSCAARCCRWIAKGLDSLHGLLQGMQGESAHLHGDTSLHQPPSAMPQKRDYEFIAIVDRIWKQEPGKLNVIFARLCNTDQPFCQRLEHQETEPINVPVHLETHRCNARHRSLFRPQFWKCKVLGIA